MLPMTVCLINISFIDRLLSQGRAVFFCLGIMLSTHITKTIKSHTQRNHCNLTNRCLFKPFHLLLTNTKIINQYRLTYTLCSELNSVLLFFLTHTCNTINQSLHPVVVSTIFVNCSPSRYLCRFPAIISTIRYKVAG